MERGNECLKDSFEKKSLILFVQKKKNQILKSGNVKKLVKKGEEKTKDISYLAYEKEMFDIIQARRLLKSIVHCTICRFLMIFYILYNFDNILQFRD